MSSFMASNCVAFHVIDLMSKELGQGQERRVPIIRHQFHEYRDKVVNVMHGI